MKKTLIILICLLWSISLVGCQNAYNKRVENGAFTYFCSSKEAFVYAYNWDGKEESMNFEIPHEVDGKIVKSLGDSGGRGRAFHICIPADYFEGQNIQCSNQEKVTKHVDLEFTAITDLPVEEYYQETKYYQTDTDVVQYNIIVNFCLDADGENYIPIDDEAFDSYVNDVVILADGEMIDVSGTGWVEKDVCYHVSIERCAPISGEYKHLRDYIFVKNDDVIKYIMVEYPSKQETGDVDRYVYEACDFHVNYEDVNFDGHNDIILFLGNITTAGNAIYCAYLYDEGEYIYNKSFEKITNYSIDSKEHCIIGIVKEKAYKYVFENGEFVCVDAWNL